MQAWVQIVLEKNKKSNAYIQWLIFLRLNVLAVFFINRYLWDRGKNSYCST